MIFGRQQRSQQSIKKPPGLSVERFSCRPWIPRGQPPKERNGPRMNRIAQAAQKVNPGKRSSPGPKEAAEHHGEARRRRDGGGSPQAGGHALPGSPQRGRQGRGGSRGEARTVQQLPAARFRLPLVCSCRQFRPLTGSKGTRCARFRCAAGMPRVVRADPGGGCGAAVGLRGCKAGPRGTPAPAKC